jgi:hypothetical protein
MFLLNAWPSGAAISRISEDNGLGVGSDVASVRAAGD